MPTRAPSDGAPHDHPQGGHVGRPLAPQGLRRTPNTVARGSDGCSKAEAYSRLALQSSRCLTLRRRDARHIIRSHAVHAVTMHMVTRPPQHTLTQDIRTRTVPRDIRVLHDVRATAVPPSHTPAVVRGGGGVERRGRVSLGRLMRAIHARCRVAI